MRFRRKGSNMERFGKTHRLKHSHVQINAHEHVHTDENTHKHTDTRVDYHVHEPTYSHALQYQHENTCIRTRTNNYAEKQTSKRTHTYENTHAYARTHTSTLCRHNEAGHQKFKSSNSFASNKKSDINSYGRCRRCRWCRRYYWWWRDGDDDDHVNVHVFVCLFIFRI